MRQNSFILLFILCLISTDAFAQVFESHSIAISGNYSNINSDFKEINDVRKYKIGFGLGFHVQKSVYKKVDFTTGIEFSYQRYETDFTQQATDPMGNPIETFGDKTTNVLYSLSIPAFAKISGPANFFALAGPRFDFKLGSEIGNVEVESEGQPLILEDPIYEQSEFFVIGWSAGIGKVLSVSGLKPTIGFRYNGDLTKLIRDDDFIPTRKRRVDIRIKIPLPK